jgi:hypothetical protein
LAVTLFALWLGWNLHQVRHRERLVNSAGVYKFDSGTMHAKLKNAFATTSHVPLAWSLLGAKHVHYMHLDRYRITDADFEHYKAMFPEADLWAGYVVADDRGLESELKPRTHRPKTAGRLPNRRDP